MRLNKSTIAKITKPNLPGILPRKRLLDSIGTRSGEVVWISGPPGSGKTALAANYIDSKKAPCLWYQLDRGDADIATFFYYMGMAVKKASPSRKRPMPLLTPEYLAGIQIFARRYFEELCNRCPPPFTIVFDNYHELPADSNFHDIISGCLDVFPKGFKVIIISREEPPPQFARLRSDNKVNLLGWDDIRFSLDETRSVLSGKCGPDDKALERIYERTEGWAAGLVLMIESARLTEGKGGYCDRTSAHNEVFDYFAGEIFGKLDGQTQDFLLRTSFLPNMTVQMAESLTGSAGSGRILSGLSRRRYFTERRSHARPSYQYHPLFREFLLSRASTTLSPEEIRSLRIDAAGLLEGCGQVEDAVPLFRDAVEYGGIIRIAMTHAPVLMAQGRSQTLHEWLLCIPEEMTGNAPWLLYWRGACRMLFAPAEGRKHLEMAFKLFEASGDTTGTLLAWSAIADSFILEGYDLTPLDRWIDWLDKHAGAIAFSSREVEARVAASMTSALVWRRPQHPDIMKWVKRTVSLSRTMEDISQRTHNYLLAAYYFVGVGDMANFGIILDEIEQNASIPSIAPLVVIDWKWLAAQDRIFAKASYGEGLGYVEEGLEISQKSGIFVWYEMLLGIGFCGAISKGDMALARGYLKRMESSLTSTRRFSISQYNYLAALYHMLSGNLPKAVALAETSLDIIRECGPVFPTMAAYYGVSQALHAIGNFKAAEEHLKIAEDIGQSSNNHMFRYMSLLAEAHLATDMGDEARCLERLRTAMRLGRERGYIGLYWWENRPVLTRLFAKALEAGIETGYVQGVISKRGLFPDKPPFDIVNWPWPVKVRTLGSFEILVDGEKVKFQGKVQQRPLLLLKALIALGGEDVREAEVTDLLWPEADGDAAHSAFTSTLSRLRQILGMDKAIRCQDGRVTLDPRRFWVDTWAFDHFSREAGTALKGGDPSDAKRLMEKAVELYRGDFLPGDSAQPWTLVPREHLRNGFLRIVSSFGGILEDEGRFEDAIDLYGRALEVDELIEEFYQRMMECHRRLDRRTEAIRVYRRCRKIFSEVFGVEPSKKTEAIYKSLL